MYRLPVEAKLGSRVGILPPPVNPSQDEEVLLHAESGTAVAVPLSFGFSDGLQGLDRLGFKTCHSAIYHNGRCNQRFWCETAGAANKRVVRQWDADGTPVVRRWYADGTRMGRERYEMELRDVMGKLVRPWTLFRQSTGRYVEEVDRAHG